jgi:hypothetical protein
VKFNPKAYAPGDVVEIRQTFKVHAADSVGLRVEDVRSGEGVVFYPEDDTMCVTMVKRAARRKPKTGETLTGREVVQLSWKRGSMIRCTAQAGLTAIVLFADGKWRDVGGVGSYEFR